MSNRYGKQAESNYGKGKRGHGMSRYIDADALVKRLKHSPLFLGTNMQFKDGVIDLVEKQPTADVAPIADTVRKMQERFSSLLSEEYRKYTPEGADQYFKNGAYMMRAIADRLIILIAKEMLEGENGIQNK